MDWKQSQSLRRQLPILSVILLAVWCLKDALFRDLWFDEALTLMNFALPLNPGGIYRAYVIPNNQIIHTMLLHLWCDIVPLAFLRLFPALTGLALLLLLYRLFRVRLGGLVLLPVLTAFAVSLPFAIYATALRGYILSALLVVAALGFAMNYARNGRAGSFAGYAAFSLLAVGCIPSNLLALDGVVLYVLPLCGRAFFRQKRFWILAVTPPLALALFYLPIARQFLAAAGLKEGWRDGGHALWATYSAFTAAFAMFILPVLLSFMPMVGRRYNWIFSARLAIILLPIPACLLLSVAPFPRVFFPLWPLGLLLIAGALKRLLAWQSRLHRRWSKQVFLIALFLAAAGWGLAMRYDNLQIALSRRFGDAGADDYYAPYYMRNDFQPLKLFRDYLAANDAAVPAVYMSFSADPWALMWAGQIGGLETGHWLFDGPRGRVPSIPAGSLVILEAAEAPESVTGRFGGRLQPLLQRGRNTLYRFSRR